MRSVVSIGTFDGVHLGHQRLFARELAEAKVRGLRTVVVTFDRHPSVTVRPQTAPKVITDVPLKLELIEQCGVDEVVVLDFTPERAEQSAEAFVEELVTDLEAALVVVGENFRFGHDHRGDVALLGSLGERLGFEAMGISLVADDATRSVVSSRHIRSLITEGALEDAARLLGRPYELRGEWVGKPGGGAITLASDRCRPPAGEYEVALRLSGQSPTEHTVGLRIDGFGHGEVAGSLFEFKPSDGQVVGAVFAPR
jgi:riboflavin kinase/FMN adenylyltransferase